MRKELVSGAVALGLTIVSIGSACQRPPEAQRPPPTSISASGVPRPPQPDFQAAVQAAVRATVTAQQPTSLSSSPETKPEKRDMFTSSIHNYQISLPEGWDVIRAQQKHEKDIFDNNTLGIRISIKSEPLKTRTLFGLVNTIITTRNNTNQAMGSNGRFSYQKRTFQGKEAFLLLGKIEQSQNPYGLGTLLFVSGSTLWELDFITKPDSDAIFKGLAEFEERIKTFQEQEKQQAESSQKPPQQAARPAEAQKPPSVEKQAIRLKPEELFRALLTTPLENNELPTGFTSKGKSAGNLDATAQALKAIGQVNVLVVEPDPRFLGMPSGGISYTIFPDASRTKDAYNMFAKRPDSRTISDSPYPTAFLIEQSPFAKVSVCVVLAENTFIAATLTSIDQTPQETKTITLAQAGVKHLQRVGR